MAGGEGEGQADAHTDDRDLEGLSDDEAQDAYDKGMSGLGESEYPSMPPTGDWIESLDNALANLDKLKRGDKETLVKSLIETVTAGGSLVAGELELLRAVCAMLHVPVPIIPADMTAPRGG